MLLGSQHIIGLYALGRIGLRGNGRGVLIARNKVYRHARGKYVDQLKKSVVIAIRRAYIARDAYGVVARGFQHGGDGGLIRAVFVAVQIADVQDAELLQILA